jgi:hypothetical protein
MPVSDYGIFSRLRHPNNSSATVVAVSGITTLGVLGAAQAFGPGIRSTANVEALLRSSPQYFSVVVQAKRSENVLESPTVIWDSLLSLE